ncbi:hypothetical protein BDI4_1880010 [Burkholderia diffusa]|nr:hypothetical protein BDI4_1880010 [Burkholderia diffusa]
MQGLEMIKSAEEFVALRDSSIKGEYDRASLVSWTRRSEMRTGLARSAGSRPRRCWTTC